MWCGECTKEDRRVCFPRVPLRRWWFRLDTACSIAPPSHLLMDTREISHHWTPRSSHPNRIYLRDVLTPGRSDHACLITSELVMDTAWTPREFVCDGFAWTPRTSPYVMVSLGAAFTPEVKTSIAWSIPGRNSHSDEPQQKKVIKNLVAGFVWHVSFLATDHKCVCVCFGFRLFFLSNHQLCSHPQKGGITIGSIGALYWCYVFTRTSIGGMT